MQLETRSSSSVISSNLYQVDKNLKSVITCNHLLANQLMTSGSFNLTLNMFLLKGSTYFLSYCCYTAIIKKQRYLFLFLCFGL